MKDAKKLNRAFALLFFLFLLILLPLVYSGNYWDGVTHGYVNTNFCRKYGNCVFGSLTVDNLSVIGSVFNVTVNDYYVTGTIYGSNFSGNTYGTHYGNWNKSTEYVLANNKTYITNNTGYSAKLRDLDLIGDYLVGNNEYAFKYYSGGTTLYGLKFVGGQGYTFTRSDGSASSWDNGVGDYYITDDLIFTSSTSNILFPASGTGTPPNIDDSPATGTKATIYDSSIYSADIGLDSWTLWLRSGANSGSNAGKIKLYTGTGTAVPFLTAQFQQENVSLYTQLISQKSITAVGFTEKINALAGESIIPKDLCYLNKSGYFKKANSNNINKSIGILAMANATLTNGQTGSFILGGELMISGIKAGVTYYINSSNGKMANHTFLDSNITRIVGYGTGTNRFLFKPDSSYVRAI